MFEWQEVIDPDRPILCPSCKAECPPEFLQHAFQILNRCVVSVIGCPHKAFTLSRRSRKRYLYPIETAEEALEGGEIGDNS